MDDVDVSLNYETPGRVDWLNTPRKAFAALWKTSTRVEVLIVLDKVPVGSGVPHAGDASKVCMLAYHRGNTADVNVSDDGLSAILAFDGANRRVVVPWPAIASVRAELVGPCLVTVAFPTEKADQPIVEN